MVGFSPFWLGAGWALVGHFAVFCGGLQWSVVVVDFGFSFGGGAFCYQCRRMSGIDCRRLQETAGGYRGFSVVA